MCFRYICLNITTFEIFNLKEKNVKHIGKHGILSSSLTFFVIFFRNVLFIIVNILQVTLISRLLKLEFLNFFKLINNINNCLKSMRQFLLLCRYVFVSKFCIFYKKKLFSFDFCNNHAFKSNTYYMYIYLLYRSHFPSSSFAFCLTIAFTSAHFSSLFGNLCRFLLSDFLPFSI